MSRSPKLEEAVAKIFMEAAYRLSGVLSADLFFLFQTGDGRRRFCGREQLVDDFVTGDLRFHEDDEQFRFYDDLYDDLDFVENEEESVEKKRGNEDDALSDVSEDESLDLREKLQKKSSVPSESQATKRKIPANSSSTIGPSEKVPRKDDDEIAGKKKSTSASRSASSSKEMPKLMDAEVAANRKKSVEKKSNEASHQNDKRGATPANDGKGIVSHVILRYLPEMMADANIRSKLDYLFKKFGARIQGVQIIHKNPKHARSRYAIVACDSRAQAQKVVQLTRQPDFVAKCNFKNCQMQAEIIHKFNELDPRATRTLRISNLHDDVDKSELRRLFDPFGEIYSLEMRHANNEQGRNVRMAYIQYSSVETAVRAREKLIGHKIGGLPLLIGFVKSHKTNCIILNNVDTRTVARDMQNRFGTLNEVYVKREQRQALLFFRDHDCAVKAMEVIAQKKLAGVNVQIDYASVDLQDAFLCKDVAAVPSSGAAEKVNLVRLEGGCGIPVEKYELASNEALGVIAGEDGNAASDISDDEMLDDVDESGAAEDTRGSPAPSGGGPKIIRTSKIVGDDCNVSKPASESPSDANDDDAVNYDDPAPGSKRLFVGNLGGKVSEAEIRQEFEPFGVINQLEMSADNAYCFVKYEDAETDAHSNAMDALNGKKIGEVEILICMD